MPPGKYYYSSTPSDAPEEYHAFWDNAFSGLGESDNSTFLISAPALDTLDPAGVDFYEMRRRNIPNSTFALDLRACSFLLLITREVVSFTATTKTVDVM